MLSSVKVKTRKDDIMIRSEKTPMISLSAIEELGFDTEEMNAIRKYYATEAGIPVEIQILQLVQEIHGNDGLVRIIAHHFGDEEGIRYLHRINYHPNPKQAINIFKGLFWILWQEELEAKSEKIHET